MITIKCRLSFWPDPRELIHDVDPIRPTKWISSLGSANTGSPQCRGAEVRRHPARESLSLGFESRMNEMITTEESTIRSERSGGDRPQDACHDKCDVGSSTFPPSDGGSHF